MKNKVKYLSFILFSALSFGMFLGGARALSYGTPDSATIKVGESVYLYDDDNPSLPSAHRIVKEDCGKIGLLKGGLFSAQKPGKCTARIHYFGLFAGTVEIKYDITVVDQNSSSSDNNSSTTNNIKTITQTMKKGSSFNLNTPYTYCFSSNESVVKVEENNIKWKLRAVNFGNASISCGSNDGSGVKYEISVLAPDTPVPDKTTAIQTNACLDANSKGCAQIDASANIVDAPTKYTEAGFCTDSVIKLNPKSEWASGSPVTGLSTTKTYTVTAHCTDDSSSTYTAYCVDPAVKGPTESGWEYTADEQLDLDSDFGKAIYCLYKNSGGADYTTIQDTARLLMVKYGQPFLGIANGPYKRHALMYQSYGGSTSLMGTVESCISSVQNNSMQMSFTQLSNSYVNGNVTVKYRLILKNPKSGVDINSVDIAVKDVNGGSVGYTKTVENVVNGDNQISADIVLVIPAGSNCTLNVTASLKYNDPDDVRNVFFARAKKNNMAQRFLVINNKGNAPLTLTETASLNLSDNPSCVPNTPEDSPCVATSGFLCTPSETVATVYEGKNVGASAEWETCIVDKSDPNGNEYTIQEAGSHNYCKVVCKEDYAFKMPGDLGTIKQGRYISINLDNIYHAVAGVAAQRTCVTVNNSSSQGIAIEKYKTDALAKKKEMLDYLNLYNYYKGMLNRLTESDNGGLTQITSDVYLTSNDDVNGPKKQTKVWTKSSGCVPVGDYSWKDEEIDYYNDFDFEFKFNKYKFNTNNSDTLSILKAEIVIDKENIDGKSDNSKNAPSGISSTGTIASNKKDETRDAASGKQTTTTPKSKDDPTRPSYCDTEDYLRVCNDVEEKSCSTATYSVTFGKEEDAKGNYEDAVNRITEAKEAARKKYESARSELQSMTEEIGMCTNWKTDYQFDPEITFTYDESSYMEMMNGNNKLKMDGDAKVNSTTYYCSSNVGYNSFESCSSAPSSDNTTYTFLGGKLNDDGTINTGDSMAYYNYKMIGSIDKYGDVAGQQFIYFKSMVPFYTYPSKGFVTANEKQPNSQLVDIDDPNRGSNEADGLIYPISLTTPAGNYTYTLKFANIGQYFNSSKNLGRIMGANGYLSGTAQDQFVCTYKVESIIPPTPDTPDPEPGNTCEIIKASDVCKGSPMSDECFSKLLSESCCDYIDLNKDVTQTRIDDYNAACPRSNTCSGYKTINYTTTIGSYDSVKVTDNGKLQFYVKSVSLNNLFPNGDNSKGINWIKATSGAENNGQSQDTANIIKEIEDKGEQIYGDDNSLIYSIKLTPACMAHVREYNKEQETNSLGFADYTLTTNYGDKSKGANDSSTFLSQLENSGCVVYKNKLN